MIRSLLLHDALPRRRSRLALAQALAQNAADEPARKARAQQRLGPGGNAFTHRARDSADRGHIALDFGSHRKLGGHRGARDPVSTHSALIDHIARLHRKALNRKVVCRLALYAGTLVLDIDRRARWVRLLGHNLRPCAQLCRADLSQLVASCLHVHKHLAFGLRGDTLGNGARIHVAELGAVHNPLARRARSRHPNRNRAVEATATLKMRFFDTPTPRQRHLRERLASRSIACGMELEVADAGSTRRGCAARR